MLELSIVYYAEHHDVNSHHRQVTFTLVVWTLHSSHAWDFKVQQWLNLRTWGVNNLLSIEALNQTFHGQSSTPSTLQSKLLRGYLICHSSTGGHSDWGFRGEQLSIKELLMWFVWLTAAPLTSLRINSSLIKLKATKANSCCQQVCMSLYHKQWNWANGKFA